MIKKRFNDDQLPRPFHQGCHDMCDISVLQREQTMLFYPKPATKNVLNPHQILLRHICKKRLANSVEQFWSYDGN